MADAADEQPEAEGQPVAEAAPRPRRLTKVKLCDRTTQVTKGGSQEEIEGGDEGS